MLQEANGGFPILLWSSRPAELSATTRGCAAINCDRARDYGWFLSAPPPTLPLLTDRTERKPTLKNIKWPAAPLNQHPLLKGELEGVFAYLDQAMRGASSYTSAHT